MRKGRISAIRTGAQALGRSRRRILRHAAKTPRYKRMIRYFDMDDRRRLPWRFFGLSHSLLALG
ncbi:hypothetical protein [Alkalilacustris brevis]|uniref:hypothetical protein n=1 Tax=Alkalilacustris brevis TaxID=2026338 RepID=UPI001EE3A89A|nr:hypothetical protein [Alkalilacustris brevis]